MLTKESIIQKLKEKGLKLTRQRLAIIDVLVKHGHLHPGAYFIYREANKKRRNLSLSSVYAIINEFSKHGILKTIQFEGVENRCECNLYEHINLICEHCGKIIDYEVPVSLDPREVVKKTGFMIINNRLEYYGYCGECTKGKVWSIDGRKPHSTPL